MLVTWLYSQPFAHRASSFLASVGVRKRGFANGHSDGSQKKPLQYSPWNGSFSFWYKNRLLTFRSVQNENRFFPKEEISVSCIGRSSQVLKDLLNECRTEYLRLVKNKTSIFKHRNGDWDKVGAVDVRQPNTVIINEEKKIALLEDIKCFLESQAWYSGQGIPHRKGYLLYGPPGTGKSSLSLLIAGECDLDVYILNLSRVDDDSLDELFNKLPARCVVLLEDIDAVNSTHSRQRGTVTATQHDTTFSAREKPEAKVSLFTLLNVIDGIGSQEGRLLIMTTNHEDRLDPALIRPGRVDVKLELGLTTKDINAQLFLRIFGRGALDGKEGAEDAKFTKLAVDFANLVPEQEFSPADIQLFLLENRKSPAMAVHNVQEWILRSREEKGHITRADPSIFKEGLSGDIHRVPTDKPNSPSAITEDSAQAREVASGVALDSHCCSCQVVEDIRGICRREEIPSVLSSCP